jgi:CRP-like cAMP-binding protein
LILDGELRVRLMAGDAETTLATLEAGECFGEIALFDHGMRSADVVANKDSTLLRIGVGAVQKLAQDQPQIATPFLWALGRTLAARIRQDNKRHQTAFLMAKAVRGDG